MRWASSFPKRAPGAGLPLSWPSRAVRGALVLVLAGACAGPAAETGSASGPAVYEMRGVVRQLPAPGGQLLIHHEAVPDFRDMRGEVAGMDAMTMPFVTAQDLDLSSLEVGDKVEFRLRVDWSESPAALITEIRRLPAATELEF